MTVSPGESRARVCGWVPSAGQVSLSVSVGWGDTTFHATLRILRIACGAVHTFLKRIQRSSARSEPHHWTHQLISSPRTPCAPQTEHSWPRKTRFPGNEQRQLQDRIGAIPRSESPWSDFRAERCAPDGVRRRHSDHESPRRNSEPCSGCTGRSLDQCRRICVFGTSERL